MLLPYSSKGKFKIPEYASDPASPSEGLVWLNTVSNQIKTYYGGTVQILHTLTGGGGGGTTPFILRGQPIGLMGVTYADDVS